MGLDSGKKSFSAEPENVIASPESLHRDFRKQDGFAVVEAGASVFRPAWQLGLAGTGITARPVSLQQHWGECFGHEADFPSAVAERRRA
ncbi:MAG: hypothetical protein U0V70_11840 [Terriglobia bacterium]